MLYPAHQEPGHTLDIFNIADRPLIFRESGSTMEIHHIELRPAIFRMGIAECTDGDHNAMAKR